LALKQYFGGRACTVLMLDDRTGGVEDDHLQSIAPRSPCCSNSSRINTARNGAAARLPKCVALPFEADSTISR
jgi:hypothetical protein